MKVFQVWYETEVGPIFTTKEKAIKYLKGEDEDFEYSESDYPDIREFEVDTGYISQENNYKREFFDR